MIECVKDVNVRQDWHIGQSSCHIGGRDIDLNVQTKVLYQHQSLA